MRFDVLISAASGAVVTLFSVTLGSLLTRRAQAQHWSRDRQIDACTTVLRESTAIQLEFRKLRQTVERGGKGAIDWVPWNQALALISLVGSEAIVEAAMQLDRTTWLAGTRVDNGLTNSSDAWATVRDEIERDRLNFVNTARTELIGSSRPIARLIGRPPLSELLEIDRSALHPGSNDPGTVEP
ncbi:MAG: hypothetical protein JWO59_3238 [Chloroflexi bacterium]|nr:hypothetical protein [Chloroflexota bacterium]